MSNFLLSDFKEEAKLEKKAIREGFGDGILQAGQANKDVVLLNADLPGSLKVEKFAKAFPDRYFQVGVAEQNMVGIGTGLARQGKIPFTSTFAAFSPGLSFSQIRLACMGHQSLKVVGSHYGLNVGPDGASAQMNSDVAMMKALPAMTILNPADYNQAIQATIQTAEIDGPVYLRVTRDKFPVFITPDSEFQVGKAQKFLDGDDVTVIATGSIVYESLQAVLQLIEKGIGIDFLNMHTIKPLDEEAIIASAKKTGKVIVVEEHNIWGGLGESVARVLAREYPCKMEIIGVQDTFGESARDFKQLWRKYGLDREAIRKKVESLK